MLLSRFHDLLLASLAPLLANLLTGGRDRGFPSLFDAQSGSFGLLLKVTRSGYVLP